MPAYMDALIREVEGLAASVEDSLPVHTVFFGGGTPSLLPAGDLARILEAIRAHYALDPEAEISLEANPGTLSLAQLEALRAAGFNRLSLGVQSASPEELRLLERGHDFPDVIRAVSWARRAGFANINLDLIFALPAQTLAAWQRNLELALGLQPEHLSLYALSIEHGTPFKEMSARGLFPLPDPDLAAEMYEHAMQRLGAVGYAHYEISNWARRGPDGALLACRHNLQYWRSWPYAGFGAGAHGWLDGHRTANVLAPAAYIERLSSPDPAFRFPRTPASVSAERLDARRTMGDTLMMGLRLLEEGVSARDFNARFGQSLDAVYGAAIARLEARQLLEHAGPQQDTLRLTPRGRLLGNQVFMEFV
jgi:oxygen-independent coproporphyrinogen-3 oxidase